MITLAFSIVILTVTLLTYLLVGLNTRHKSTQIAVSNDNAPVQNKEIRALIIQFEQDKAHLAALDEQVQATRLAELESRLYHEITPIVRKTQRETNTPPLWAYIVVIVAIFAALVGWYVHGGHYVWQWQKLEHSMDSALARSQYLDELPEQMPPEVMSTYCLVLQNKIDRNDLNQLDTLAQCVASYGNYQTARDIYQHIYRKAPNNTDNIINYAQMSLFSQQGQPLNAELEQALLTIWRNTPDNFLAGILLASSKMQAGKVAQADLIWRQLLDTMPHDHPLYDMVQKTYQRDQHTQPSAKSLESAFELPDGQASSPPVVINPELTVTIIIPQQTIAQLTSQSRLFVLASPANSRMPIAVKRLPVTTTQTVKLTNQDSMQGQSLADYERLNVRVIISTDGQADGNIVATLEQIIDTRSAETSQIKLNFNFSNYAAP